jgi:signal transduction histidine kinase
VDYLHKPVNAAVLRSKVAVFAELHKKGLALEAANRLLQAEVAERRRAEARLSELNESLDRRVNERTRELQASEARLRDAGARKDEFLATLAHELRNPLAPVRNAVQLLKRQGQSDEMVWASELIDRQVSAMSRLIDDLMDVSRINQGRIELRRETVDLKDVLADAVESSRPLLAEMGHELARSEPAGALPVHADRTRLAQAFMNLLNNAIKYMDPGGRIDVTLETGDDEVVVTVKDRGIGIPADRLENVFEMFSQVESALARSRGGLGIGLSLTQRLVKMHGGSVKAISQGPGTGSEFVVRLPLAERAEPRPSAPAGTDGLFAPRTALRVLVADDNKDAADTLAALLQLMDHEVRVVYDGVAAVEAAAEFDPQLVLLDIGMPRLNGYDACRGIRAQPGGSARTVVAVTGWGQPEDRRSSADAGFNHHLVKPIDMEALSKVLALAGQPAA